MKSVVKIIPFILLFSGSILSQYMGTNTSISFNAIFNTGARLYPNTTAEDNYTSNQYAYIENFMSYSIELKRQIADNLFLGISFEQIRAIRSLQTVYAATPTGYKNISVDEGFSAFPVELSVYYALPVSNENFIIYIGGGVGYYSGEEIRNIGNSGIDSKIKDFAWGIQVQTGLEYMLTDFISIKGEMRFRDPEFEMTNHYKDKIINYNNQRIRILQDNYNSKVNIDGISFIAGIVYRFNLL